MNNSSFSKPIPLLKVHMPNEAPEEVGDVLRSGFVATGSKTDEFENQFGEMIGNPNVIATNSCSSAIALALSLADIQPDDEVVCSALTCLAVNESVLQTGANIVWADIDPDTGNISPESIQSRITEKTKAIVYSHWVGRLAEIEAINKIADEYQLKTIEDAASALGGEYDGKPIGSHSDYVTFSFQAVKHITTGDGGMLAVKTFSERERAILLRNHGNDRKAKRSPLTLGFDVHEAGWKYQMNDISATLGIGQLKSFPRLKKIYNKRSQIYELRLKNVPGLKILKEYPKASSNLWVFTILVENQENFVKKMQEHQIGCSIIHPRNDHFSIFDPFQHNNLPNLDYFYNHMINLPVGWWLSEETTHKICDIITNGW